jgi:HD-GYP domain-containing protein (c-di-GMP phosphodiesterase class II)
MKITSLHDIDEELHNFIQDFVFSISIITEAKSCLLHITNNVIDVRYHCGQLDFDQKQAITIKTKQKEHINCALYLDIPGQFNSKLHVHIKTELELLRKLIETKLQLVFREKWQNKCYFLESFSKTTISIPDIFKTSLEYINKFIDINIEGIYFSDTKEIISYSTSSNDIELFNHLTKNIDASLRYNQKLTLYKRIANYYIYARRSQNYLLCLFFKKQIHPIYLLAISFFVNELLWMVSSTKWFDAEKNILKNLIKSFIASLEAKDVYTRGHSEGVAYYCHHIGRALNLTESELDILQQVAQLHDIGKVGIPDYVLLKPTKLTKKEFEIITLHTVVGEELIARIKELSNFASIIRHHHERWDGKGYPDRLKGLDIPLFSRIIAVADAFDAMINRRVYRREKPREIALKELARNAGTQFDPYIIKAALPVLEKIDIYSPPEDSFVPEHIEIARKEFFHKDMLTGCKNASAMFLDAQDMDVDAQFILIDIRNFHYLNFSRGHLEVDKLIIKLYDLLCNSFDENNIYRIGPDEFVIVLLRKENKKQILDKLKNIEKDLKIKININIYHENFSPENIRALIDKFKLKKYHLSVLTSNFKTLSKLYKYVLVFDKDFNIIRQKKISQALMKQIKKQKDKFHRITQYGQTIGYVYYEGEYAKT